MAESKFDMETGQLSSSSKGTSSQSSAINKDACYAAAVKALSTAPKARRSPRRGKTKVPASAPANNKEVIPALPPAKNERDLCYAAAVAALAGASFRDSLTDIEISYTTSHSSNSDDDDISYDFNEEFDSDLRIDSKEVPSADDESSAASSESHPRRLSSHHNRTGGLMLQIPDLPCGALKRGNNYIDIANNDGNSYDDDVDGPMDSEATNSLSPLFTFTLHDQRHISQDAPLHHEISSNVSSPSCVRTVHKELYSARSRNGGILPLFPTLVGARR